MLFLTIEELRYLVEAGECGSFSSAAEKLYISPQGLSQGIRHLEQDLNVKIFHRTNAGVTLTDIGLQIYERAVNILDNLERIDECISSNRKEHIKKLSCAVKASRIGNQVKKHLKEFQEEYGILVDVLNFHDLKQRGKIISSNKTDLIFEFDELMINKDNRRDKQVVFKLCMEPIVNMVNSIAYKESLCWNDLKNITFVAESDKHLYIPLLKKQIRELGIEEKIEYCFNVPYCLEEVSKNPTKVFFTTEHIFSQSLKGKTNLKCCTIKDPLCLEYSVYTKGGLSKDPICGKLVSFMQNKLKNYSTFKSQGNDVRAI